MGRPPRASRGLSWFETVFWALGSLSFLVCHSSEVIALPGFLIKARELLCSCWPWIPAVVAQYMRLLTFLTSVLLLSQCFGLVPQPLSQHSTPCVGSCLTWGEPRHRVDVGHVSVSPFLPGSWSSRWLSEITLSPGGGGRQWGGRQISCFFLASHASLLRYVF